MRKVISGARYDTDAAKRLGHWESDRDHTGFSHTEETLYRTKAGKWFLYGTGNAASIYASRRSDGWSGSGEQIIPLSEEAARQWAELHLTGEETEQIFSALNSRITPVAAYVPADLLEKLDAEKSRSGRSRSDIVIDALRKYL